MKIVCIGWGSLIWDPQDLPVEQPWFDNGPLVRVEFTRQSKDGRITLVITPKVKPVRALWAVFRPMNVDQAREALRKREGTPQIKRIRVWTRNQRVPNGYIGFRRWVRKNSIDVVMWTGLGPKFGEEDGRIPTSAEVIRYLRDLEEKERCLAERYVRRAPAQIGSVYRQEIEKELGWVFSENFDCPVRA